MKKLVLLSLLYTMVAACQNSKQENNVDADDKGEKSEIEKKITKRDNTINSSNSYTNIFLDSVAVENYITAHTLNDSLKRRIRSFYNARNYQFAWFSDDGLTEQGRSFWNLHENYLAYHKDSVLDDKVLRKKMNYLSSEDALHVNPSDKSFINSEIGLTHHFIQYILTNYEAGQIKRKEMERFVPLKKQDAMYLADSLLTKKHKDNKYYADVNTSYKLLQDQLGKYYGIAKKGGWEPINMTEKKLRKGMSSPAVFALKQRLQLTGEMPAGDTTATFDDQLESAVKTYQISRGITGDGTVTPALVKDMNVPALKRIQQILINMGRMRWLLTPEAGNLVVVNIPEFMLHVFDGKKKEFEMPVVVGKEGHNTMMFTGKINQVVFSPYWNVTQSIVEKEILPAMNNDPNYLSRNNMEIVGDEGGIPKIRQLPGPKNSLGKVKFLFPNSFDIYLHDTPAKSLFNNDKRAYSHGCIRLSDPYKMALYVLRNNKEWTPDKISAAMDAGTEQFVSVKKPVPVLITYYTAWVDENGVLNFRDDIYNHDQALATKMFVNPL